jgi:RHS repeat-associated protein
VVERLSYDPWGQRRNVNWSAAAGLISAFTHHGFTGHEHLDAVGIVHMNGRLYEPRLGRFLQADPTVQFADNPQNLNRYSYVLNNPLSFTDPSGYSIKGIFKAIGDFFSKYWRPILAVAIMSSTARFTPRRHHRRAGTAPAGNRRSSGRRRYW